MQVSPRRFIAPAVFALTAMIFSGHPASAQNASLRLNPNTATMAEMAEIDGLPGNLADAILAARPFKRTDGYNKLVSEQLDGEERTVLYEQLFLPIDLNKATSEEISIIPGMSRRMIHEFEEYRPYTSIDQFNREIGKYVSTEEVARLRSYVILGD